jgi:hypothetical protein
MALVQLTDQRRNRSESRFMAAPKNASNLTAWFKAARQALPSIPDPHPDYMLINTQLSLNWIAWEMVHRQTSERLYVVIDRKSKR